MMHINRKTPENKMWNQLTLVIETNDYHLFARIIINWNTQLFGILNETYFFNPVIFLIGKKTIFRVLTTWNDGFSGLSGFSGSPPLISGFFRVFRVFRVRYTPCLNVILKK